MISQGKITGRQKKGTKKQRRDGREERQPEEEYAEQPEIRKHNETHLTKGKIE